MKLGDFKARLRKAPEVKAKEWKKALPAESMNCPECLGTGKADEPGSIPSRSCNTCGGSGLQLSGAPKKRRETKSDRAKSVAEALERGVIRIPPGTKVSLEGPIKGRSATVMIMDDPIMTREESKKKDDIVEALMAGRKLPMDFLEDLYTTDETGAPATCTDCGMELKRRADPDDHANDCIRVVTKKCVDCKKSMGLCFKQRNPRPYRCPPCIRAKYRSER